MCTAIATKTANNEHFLSRTLDFSYDMHPTLYHVPAGYLWTSSGPKATKNPYSFLAIGRPVDGELSFFDGVNDQGFAAAALYFPGYTTFDDERYDKEKKQITLFDFLHYMLGSCKSVMDLYTLVKSINLTGQIDPLTNTLVPLHWIAADRSGKCVTIERVSGGLSIFNNEIGVLANSPEFPWQLANLQNYTEVSPTQTTAAVWDSIKLVPFGQGTGTSGLPGGFSSPARFINTAYLKTHLPEAKQHDEAVINCFNTLKNAFVPKGAVMSEWGPPDYTIYTAAIDLEACAYYFNTYQNPQIIHVKTPVAYQPGGKVTVIGCLDRPVYFNSMNSF